MAGWHGRYAHIHGSAGYAQRNTPVLGQALLGDIQLRHDLDARDHQRCHGAPGLQHLLHDAVDTEAHHKSVFKRLDMDVGCILLYRRGQDRIDQPDYRRVIIGLEQVRGFRQILRDLEEVSVFFQPLDHLLGLVAFALIRFLQQIFKLVRIDNLHLQLAADDAPDL